MNGSKSGIGSGIRTILHGHKRGSDRTPVLCQHLGTLAAEGLDTCGAPRKILTHTNAKKGEKFMKKFSVLAVALAVVLLVTPLSASAYCKSDSINSVASNGSTIVTLNGEAYGFPQQAAQYVQMWMYAQRLQICTTQTYGVFLVVNTSTYQQNSTFYAVLLQ